MEKYYAQALWKMVSEGMSPAKALGALREVLTAHGRTALLPRIGKEFARIAQREAARGGVTLTIAREKDERAAKSAVKEILAKLDFASKKVAVTIDDSLIGGWRLEGKEMLVDGSYKKQLLELFNKSVR